MVVFLFKLFANKFARDNNYTYLYINIKKAVQLLKLCKKNMATIANTIKKAEKLTGNKVEVNPSNGKHFVQFNGYTVSWFANGRLSNDAEAICFYTANRPRTEDDMNSDYFPGTFHDNLTQAIKFISK